MPYKTETDNKEYQKEYYRKNKEKYLQSQQDRRTANKKLVAEIKSKAKCEICGESHPGCLDFHHEEDKEIAIADAVHYWGKDRILQEIAKCKILCSNCHRKLHYDELNRSEV